MEIQPRIVQGENRLPWTIFHQKIEACSERSMKATHSRTQLVMVWPPSSHARAAMRDARATKSCLGRSSSSHRLLCAQSNGQGFGPFWNEKEAVIWHKFGVDYGLFWHRKRTVQADFGAYFGLQFRLKLAKFFDEKLFKSNTKKFSILGEVLLLMSVLQVNKWDLWQQISHDFGIFVYARKVSNS